MKQFFSHRFRRHSGDSSLSLNKDSSHSSHEPSQQQQKETSTLNRPTLKIRGIPKNTTTRRKSEADAVLMQSTHPVNTQGVYGFMDYTVHKNVNNLYTYGNQSNQF